MNVSRRRLCMTLPVVALALACTTGIVGTEPDLAGVQVADGMPDAVPAEATPKPAPKPKPKPKPKPAQPATAPEPAKPEPPLAAPEPPKPLSADEIVPILGKKVLGPAGEDLGRVVNVLVDQAGRTRAAVIDFGGFLGVGSRKIAVAWDQLTFKPGTGDRPLILNMTREQIQGAREYKERTTDQVDVATPPTPGQTPAKPSN
jgi:PRC-barrel domain